MVRNFFIIILIGLPFPIIAQRAPIKFYKAKDWNYVLLKAKNEHKMIFVDCYTTWCSPCRQMEQHVYSSGKVGQWYNNNFINVSVQMDSSAHDSQTIKSGYQKSAELMRDFAVNAFPTYLFFNADGVILHRSSGLLSASNFILIGKEALNPHKQYYKLLGRYLSGERDTTLLYTLAKAALDANDEKIAHHIIKDYLNTQANLLSKKNIRFLVYNSQHSTDPGFYLILTHGEEIDKLLGRGTSYQLTRNVIYQESVYPELRKYETDSLMSASIDWDKLIKKISVSYNEKALDIVLFSKVAFYKQRMDWKNYYPSLLEFMNSYGLNELSPDDINENADYILDYSSNPVLLQSAIKWSKFAAKIKSDYKFKDTHAKLLYKAGKFNEAIQLETEIINRLHNDDKQPYLNTISKMMKHQKLWYY